MASALQVVGPVRAVRILSLALGLAVLAYLAIRLGQDAALTTITRTLGWQFLVICLPYGLITAVDTLGWRYAFASDRVPFHRLATARVAGEAVNLITALAPVGGDAIKVWMLRFHVPYRESVASVIIAKTTIAIAQTLFLLLGVALAWALAVDRRLVVAMVWLLLIELVGAGGFFLVQLAGAVTRGARLLSRFGLLQALASAENLDRTVQRFYRRERWRFALSVGFHLLGWLLGVLETLLILQLLQVPVSLATAMLIEALGSAVRFATFFVPGSLGALEGANAAAFTALGLGAPAGLGFSLVRRGRQAVWIGIGLVVLALARARERRGYARGRRVAGSTWR
jgi:lysylphosphatidylglycerol synthase-like protein